MNTVGRIGVGIVGVMVIVVAMQLATPKVAQAVANLFVTVTNTSANPVPVTGTVSVTNTPNVNVASLPAVQIGGSVNATVTDSKDSQSNPVLVTEDDAPRNAFFVFRQCGWAGVSSCVVDGVLSVPANLIAVVQSLSGQCLIDSGTALMDAGIGDANGVSTYDALVVPGPTVTFASGLEQTFSQNVHVYVFGGTSGNSVNLRADANTSESSGNTCFFLLSGYLVNQKQ